MPLLLAHGPLSGGEIGLLLGVVAGLACLLLLSLASLARWAWRRFTR